MRSEFAAALTELAARDERVVLLTGDLGFMVWEPFMERFPDRFINVGVAEQNMLGLATGLAEAGLRPYCYSIATFATLRPYEFLRNGPLLHRLPVRLVGVGAGLDYGHNGVTHYALEDVAVMRAQPDMSIVAPADPAQAVAALAAIHELDGPAYLRIGKEQQGVAGLDGRFRLGHVEVIGGGGEIAIVALGTMATEAVAAAERLRERGVESSVVVVSSVRPSPADELATLLGAFDLAVTVEAHYRNGGLGSLVAEVIAESGAGCRLVRRAVAEMPRGLTGSPAHLRAALGLDAAAVADSVMAALERA
jgi:transketolase